MSTFNLVSWENEKVQIDEKRSASIKFLDEVPDPGMDIPLSRLEVDIYTLRKIQEFLNIEAEFPNIKKPLSASKIESVFESSSPYKTFFQDLSNDELLLLTNAAHRLAIEDLQNLCVAVIASKFAEMDANEVMNDLTEDELVQNEEDFMKWIEFKW